jgi:two-component system, chemotaxis family, protein-glutamate methylesterase/glutaminase
MTNHPAAGRTRDIVVIGCSAGGVEALPRILVQLPATLPASVFIVQHLSPAHNPYLVEILRRDSQLPVAWAEQGDPVVRGKVYVAPPDVHLLFNDDHLRLSRGARENHSRPSIDKLFRSAAALHGSRVIGVLLTGMLDDGVAGLRAIRDAGGVVIVQDPDDAAFPDLPSRALLAVAPDRTLPVDGIGGALIALTREQVEPVAVPQHLALEAAIDRAGPVSPGKLSALGTQTPVACPDCNGPTWLLGDEHSRRYRCYLGHVTSARELLDGNAEQLEEALWSAVRALNERASTLEVLATDAERIGNGLASEGYVTRAREARQHADLARQFMIDLIRPQ